MDKKAFTSPLALSPEQAAALVALAIEKKDDAALEALLQAGADPDSVSLHNAGRPQRMSALGAAVELGSLRSVQALLLAGADPEGMAGFGSVASEGSAQRRSALDVCCDGQWAKDAQREDKIKALIQAGASPLSDSGWDELCYGIWIMGGKTARLFRALIESGESVERLSSDGESPLWLAVKNDSPKLAEALLSMGADPDLPAPLLDAPQTPLELAVKNESPMEGLLRAASERRAIAGVLARAPGAPSRSM